VFWALALIGLALFAANYKLLPETLSDADRQPFNLRNLFRGYREVSSSGKFWLLALASGIPFNGMFLYVLSAPAFLSEHLLLKPTEYFWFFCCVIGGIMGGAALSGRFAGKIQPKRQIRMGFVIMLCASLVNLAYNFTLTPSFPFAMLPIAAFAFGWSLMVPVVTILVLDMFPSRRGLVSSLQAVVGSAANGVVAGLLAPLVMHSTRGLALASLGLMCVGLAAWLWVKRSVARVELAHV
jgi:MFS transporter, DHA1 family, multidrug resistance protein